MKEQRITIEIDAEGKIVADADGFSGDACLKELDRLLEGIAATRERIERKPDVGETRTIVKAAQKVGQGKKP